MFSSGWEGSSDRLYETVFIPLNAGKIKKNLKIICNNLSATVFQDRT